MNSTRAAIVALMVFLGGVAKAKDNPPLKLAETISLPGLKAAFSQSDLAVAEANGFFKEQALTVQTQGLASGVKTVQLFSLSRMTSES